MNYAEKQKAEIETIAPRAFNLNLSDADVKRLYEKAAGASVAPEQLLENFIADLVCGTNTNGSDERMYIEQWFDRCWFSLDSCGSFLAYLVKNCEFDNFTELQETVTECTEELSELDVNDFDNLEEYNEEREYTRRRLEQANSEIKELFDEYSKRGENPETIEQEIKRISQYRESLKKALAHEKERTV